MILRLRTPCCAATSRSAKLMKRSWAMKRDTTMNLWMELVLVARPYNTENAKAEVERMTKAIQRYLTAEMEQI